MSIKNPRIDLANDFVKYTGKNIFLTGKAGTGKTTFLHNLRSKTGKRMVVVAPTGVAAINAGGMTIHSFFQMPFGPIIPGGSFDARVVREDGSRFQRKFSREKINIIRSLDLLVIDEISMVRADLLDGIDEVLRQYRNRNKPFGGVQLLMIGDLQQLAPVVKDDEWEILKKYYDTAFFFSSRALKKTDYVSITLEHVYRQSDQKFIDILNKVRDNQADDLTLETLNQRYIPGFIENENTGYIILTTHNAQAQDINHSRLNKLPAKKHVCKGKVTDDFPEYAYPTDLLLELKVGAQVMFVKNDSDPEKRYFNGKIGIIEDIEDDCVYVACEGDDSLIAVERDEWQNVKYSLNEETKEISETISGSFTQFPLKLAWAITIHKSQGLTFEKAIIDARAAFAHGQVYVALSRCKSLEGMVLNAPLSPRCFISSNQISEFTSAVEGNQPTSDVLDKSKREYKNSLLFDLFNYSAISYHLSQCLNIAISNAPALEGKIWETFQKIQEESNRDIIKILSSFKNQLTALIEDNDEARLQERVRKAVSYFLIKTYEILYRPIQGTWVTTDNKAVRKTLDQAIDKLLFEIMAKTACLKACENGFEITPYLEARAKSTIEESPRRRKVKDSEEAVPETSKFPELYNALVKWRNAKAQEKNISHYMVIQLKTMVALSNIQPSNLRDLKKIKGIGSRKIKEYGQELLEIISRFNGNPIIESHEKEKEIVTSRSNSILSSLELFRKGLTLPEIALQRKFATATISTHLAKCIKLGKMEVTEILDPSKIKLISEAAEKTGSSFLTPIKAELGEAVTYDEIKYVLAHIEHLKTPAKEGK